MSPDTKERLIKKAPLILRFLELESKDQEWLYLLLGQSERTAIDVIEACTGCELTYLEIAELVGISLNTAKQIIYALSEAGLPFSCSKTRAAFVSTGRKRILSKIEIS